ncbi:Serine protease [Phytophthora megakarya]|uniref:Serine protease n=1 Tax=Phytophthora megakarya TaxID=4795 RepID=A0A225W6L1_9STRA|nr:Serine protease [Phytophthora megakarya]
MFPGATRVLQFAIRCTRNRQQYSLLSFLPSKKKLVPRESRAAPLPLPSPKYIEIEDHCKIEYVDIQRMNGNSIADESVTIVFLHGAPGSYYDFRYLIPLVQLPGVRIIGINLPGYEGSTVAKAHYLDSISALPTAQLTFGALQQLCGGKNCDKNVFLVGHSFGAQTAINMAALNAGMRSRSHESKPAINFRGMALLAPVGCSPHHVMRPRANTLVIKMLGSGNPLFASLASHAVKAIYTKLLRFPADLPPDPFVAAVVRAGTTDFDVAREQVALLNRLKMPTLVAWSQSDEYIQEEIPTELGSLCFPGPRLAFAGGGHNIQKTRVDPIAAAINDWIADVMSCESVSPDQEETQFFL